MKFQVNDSVIYGTEGVCRISAVTTQDFMGTPTEYYVLKPIYSAGATVFVPVDNAALTARMRRVLTPEEIEALVRSTPDETRCGWAADDAVRRAQCREILLAGDRAALVGLIKRLHRHGAQQREKGRRLHAADERILREAEKLLSEEIAYVLHVPREAVPALLLGQSDEPTRD